MHMAEARTCTLAPGGGASTLDTTDPPICMEHTWAQESPTAPRSQSFPRRLQLKYRRETRLCNTKVHVQYPGRRSLFRRFCLRLLHWSHHTRAGNICIEETDAAGQRGGTTLTHVCCLCQIVFSLNVYDPSVCSNALLK